MNDETVYDAFDRCHSEREQRIRSESSGTCCCNSGTFGSAEADRG
jgi:hypothetical protein